MPTRLIRLLLSIAIALVLAGVAYAQSTLVVHRNANLREKPTTQSKAIDHLEAGDELLLVTDTKRDRFWEVQTASGVRGWIFETLVHFEEEADEEEDPVSAPDLDVFDEFDESWSKPKPTGSPLKGPAGSSPCPARGETGGDYYTNARKNRTDVPTSYKPISFDAIMSLPDFWNEGTRKHEAPTNRTKWEPEHHKVTEPYEGVAVSIVGYINRVKRQDRGKGESTNCHFTGDHRFVDIHVALVENFDDAESEALVVEPTPRFYAKNPRWVWGRLLDLEGSRDPVRVSGWTLYDPSHGGHMGKYRKSMWEIHPITKIEVFKDGKWTVW